MATYSQSDLATRILRDAGLISAEETPSALDLAFAQETLSAEIALMAAKGITIWNGSDSSVPLPYYTALSRRIVLALGPSFGLVDAAEASVAIPKIESDLRVISQTPGTGTAQQTEYF